MIVDIFFVFSEKIKKYLLQLNLFNVIALNVIILVLAIETKTKPNQI
jgi:hypothetical protein